MDLSFRVVGRVQGVGFREFVRRTATALGVVGWVRNEQDGSVTGLAEGPEDAVRALVAQLGVGPPASRVTRVITDVGAPAACRGFEIRR